MAVRGRLACLLYRSSNRLARINVPLLPQLLFHLNALLCGCEIHYLARIGRGLIVAHPCGVIIGQNVQIGDNLRIFSGAVLGVARTGEGTQPRVGHNVIIYSGAKILGPISIGDNAVIGANSVVNRDVPEGAWVAGVPARIIRHVEPGAVGTV